MCYNSVVCGTFLERPNRFIARVCIDGAVETVHVKNTGRCRELLIPGATVYLERAANLSRKTGWSLIAVQKGGRLINMDSQAPNGVVAEALELGLVLAGFPGMVGRVRREVAWGESRLDFSVEWPQGTALLEVKGVTLEEGGAAYFPDAPTQRGVRHLLELERAVQAGFSAHVVFVVQMRGVSHFSPNDRTHPAFGQALRRAMQKGVHLHAFDCCVRPDSIALHQPVEIRL